MAKKKKNPVEASLAPQPFNPEKLYHSERGQFACTNHTPVKGSDTWNFDRWRRITPAVIEAYERDLGRKPVCETCAAIERNEAAKPATDEGRTPAEDAVAAEPSADVAGAPDLPAEPKKKGRKTKADLTLADLAERYVAHLEESGKSAGTSASYGLELKTALDELGADTKLADLTPEQVLAYFASKRVTKKKNGKHKSPLSIAKTQRVLRLALVWAVEKKLIEKAPLPEALATH